MKKEILYHLRFNGQVHPFELICQIRQAQLWMLDSRHQNRNGFEFRWESMGLAHCEAAVQLFCLTRWFRGKVHVSPLMLLPFNLRMVMQVPKE